MEPLLSGLSTFFPWLVDYTIDISVLICLIFIIKSVASKKLPAWWHYSLWIILLLRMIIPFTFENSIKIPNFVPISIDERLFESVLIEEEFISANFTTDFSSSMQQGWNIRLDEVMVILWVAFAILFGVYILVKNINFRNTINKEPLLTDKKILGLLEECKSRMKTRTPLKITITDRVKSPALFGYIHPRLLLPVGVLEKLDNAELSYIFMHELGHLKRHDIGVSWVITFLHIFQWFNPFVWFAFYQMRIDQESACDASVLSRISNNQTIDYASTIVGFLENFCRNRKLPAMVGILENQTQIKKRITMIVGYRKYSKTMMLFSTAMLAVIGALFFSLAGFAKAKPDVTVLDTSVTQTHPFYVSKDMEYRDNTVMNEKETMELTGEIEKSSILLQEGIDETDMDGEKQNLQIQEAAALIKDKNIVQEKREVKPVNIEKAPGMAQKKADDADMDYERQNLETRETVATVQEKNVGQEKKGVKRSDFAQQTPVVLKEKVADVKIDHANQNPQNREAMFEGQNKKINDDIVAAAYTENSKKAPAEVLKVFREVYNISNENKDVLNSSIAASAFDPLLGRSPLSDGRYNANDVESREYLGLAGPAFFRSENPEYTEESPEIHEKKSSDMEINKLKEVYKPPEIARSYPPMYPFKAREKGIQGRVKLRFTVNKAGRVQNPQVISAEPEGVFEQAALDTVMKYKFKPAIKDGKSVNSVVNLPISFNLSDIYLRIAQK